MGCSKTDFGMIPGRGQYAKSDGVLLQNKLPGTRKAVKMVNMVKMIVTK